MHNWIVELHGKCRRLFYAKVDIMAPGGEPDFRAGDIVGIASGGGTIELLTGNDLIVATFNDHAAPERIGCVEEYYNPIPAKKPLTIDLSKVQACCDAVDAHRNAEKAEVDFVFETGIKRTRE